MDVEQFIETYGIWAVAFAGCFEGELVSTLAGIAASTQRLPWPWVILAVWIGTFSATQGWFLGGKYAGEWVLRRRPSLQPKVDRAQNLLNRRGIWVFVFYRFLYGLRTVTPFAIGLSGASTAKFMLVDGICWFVWLGTLATIGYVMGDVAIDLLNTIVQYQKWALAIGGFVVLILVIRRVIRAKKAR